MRYIIYNLYPGYGSILRKKIETNHIDRTLLKNSILFFPDEMHRFALGCAIQFRRTNGGKRQLEILLLVD